MSQISSDSSSLSEMSSTSSSEEEEEIVEEEFEQDNELVQRLLECCEKAYSNGVNSADIYKALHSAELFESLRNEVSKQNESYQNLENQESFSNYSNSNFIYSKNDDGSLMPMLTIKRFLGFVKKIFWTVFSTLFLALLGYLLMCKILNINPLKWVPSLQDKRCLLPSHPIIMEMVRPITNCSICLPLALPEGIEIGGGIIKGNLNVSNSNHYQKDELTEGNNPVIELDEIPSKELFLKIAYSSRPIIVRGGALNDEGFSLSEETKDFNFLKLKDIFESEEGGVDNVNQECQFLPFRAPFRNLREAFDLISSDTKEWNTPWYIGWSNCHPGVASKLRKLFPRPNFLPEDSENSAIDWIFVGSPGLGAAMHIDYVKRPSWQAQLSGVKTWYLRPSPECEEICPDTIVFSIYPGDLLFLETNTWYHQTFIEGDMLSISIGSEYD